MTELQTTDDLGTGETGADLAPAEEKHEGFVSEDKAQASINKQHKKFRDEERAHVVTKTEADDLRKELDELKAQSNNVEIPPVPDPYAENYTELVQSRDEAIQRKAGIDAQQESVKAEATREENERLDGEKQTSQEQLAGFDANMVKLGLNPAETNKAAVQVLEYGASKLLEGVLLEDPDGPLLVHYLANNPIEQESLNGMSALQLVNHINEIRPKASLLKPKTSGAPDPPITLDGGGVQQLENQLPNGNTYKLE